MVLKADIEKYTADEAALTEKTAVLDEDISVCDGDVQAATKVREIETPFVAFLLLSP